MMELMRELFRPSVTLPDGAAGRVYGRMVIGMGHAVVGATAALCSFYVGSWFVYVVIALYLAKEYGDVRRGGTVQDSAEDTACVLIGLIGWIAAPLILPAVVLVVGAVIGLVATMKRKT